MTGDDSQFEQIKELKFTDGRNRKWVVFNDASFFNYYCVSCEDGTYFYFTNSEDARKFCDLIKISY